MKKLLPIALLLVLTLVLAACSSSSDDPGDTVPDSTEDTATDLPGDTPDDAEDPDGTPGDLTDPDTASDVEQDVPPDSEPDMAEDMTEDSEEDMTPPGDGPTIAGCPLFPADNPWNTDISGYAVHNNSDALIDSIGRGTTLHPDFGTEWMGAPIGIPYVLVDSTQPRVPVSFMYADESDPGPYPIPPNAPIEGGPDGEGDRHVLVVDTDACMLYELFAAYPQNGGESWDAGSGAIWDLNSNDLRPMRWTSADAAGLPILPGLARYEEIVEQGELNHALRFTVSTSRRGYILPATHWASSNDDPNLPPMGLRVRMKAGYDCSTFSNEVQVICDGLKTYGMIVADNGSDWYVSGAPDPRWSDDNLRDLRDITGDAFEVVDTGPVVTP